MAEPIQMPSEPMPRINAILDKYVLPYPVRFLTNRLTILGTLCLLIPLIFFANSQVFVNTANSYLNVMSVVVSSTVLLYSTITEVRQRNAARRREEIAQTHAETVERRAQQDHELIQKIHEHLDEIRFDLLKEVDDKLNNIQEILVDRLERIQAEDHQHVEDMHRAVMSSTESHRKELSELAELISAMHNGDISGSGSLGGTGGSGG
jgi:hypothetical protein